METPSPTRPKKPLWRRWWFIGLIIVIIAIAVGASLSPQTEETADQTSSPEAPAPEVPQPPETSPAFRDEPEVVRPTVIASKNFAGSGKEATGRFTLQDGISIFRMTHSGSSNFIVYLLDRNGEQVQLLANAIGDFNGDYGAGVAAGSYLLDINADGNWRIRIDQPRPTSAKAPPLSFSGNDPKVTMPMRLDGLARFRMRYAGDSNFIVYLLDYEGEEVELLANEIGRFSGSKAMGANPGIYWLRVQAEGIWSVAVS